MSDIQQQKAMREAIKKGDLTLVQDIVSMDSSILNVMTVFGTWLHMAAAHGQLDIAKYLISKGADINQKGGILGGSPLNEAASEGYIEIVKYLVFCGDELDVSEPTTNPLFAAIYGGHIEIVKLLISSGVDIHIRYTGENMKDMDAIGFAKERGQIEIMNLLSTAKRI